MPVPLYDANARRKTISVTINADLAAKASALGINLSRTAEGAIAAAFTRLERERIRAEVAEAIRFTDAYVAEHGRPWDDWTTENLTEDQDDDAA